jgi:hypothetical protein
VGGAVVAVLAPQVRTGSIQAPTITALIAVFGLVASVVIGYVDRILERHRLEIVPVAVEPIPGAIGPTQTDPHPSVRLDFRVLLINAGNRHTAVTRVSLNNFVGWYGGPSTSMSAPEQEPVVLAPGEMRYHVYEFQYWPTYVFADPNCGEIVDEKTKRVVWHMDVHVRDSSGGMVGDRLQRVPVWWETVSERGHSGGSFSEPKLAHVVRDRWSWLGAVGRGKR